MVRQYAPKQSAALNKVQRGVILYRTAEKISYYYKERHENLHMNLNLTFATVKGYSCHVQISANWIQSRIQPIRPKKIEETLSRS